MPGVAGTSVAEFRRLNWTIEALPPETLAAMANVEGGTHFEVTVFVGEGDHVVKRRLYLLLMTAPEDEVRTDGLVLFECGQEKQTNPSKSARQFVVVQSTDRGPRMLGVFYSTTEINRDTALGFIRVWLIDNPNSR